MLIVDEMAVQYVDVPSERDMDLMVAWQPQDQVRQDQMRQEQVMVGLNRPLRPSSGGRRWLAGLSRTPALCLE